MEGGCRVFFDIHWWLDQNVWVYVLKTKSEVFEKFKEWKAKVETSAWKKLKTLRTDNGGEFTSNNFETYFRNEGVTHQLTIPKCPQQNGVLEHLNCTLIEMVCCMMSWSNLPHKFWAEALATAPYLHNRCPLKAVAGKTAYEALMGERPNVENLYFLDVLHFTM